MAHRRSRRRSRRVNLGAMTKQDFVAVAQVIRDADISPQARCGIAAAFGRYAMGSNPRFDQTRFSRAAGCG